MITSPTRAPPPADVRVPGVLSVTDLVKRYGELVAIDGMSFEVQAGTIFALVGPNGSGKTSTVECLEGLRRPDGGTVRVLGLDPHRDRRAVHARVGVMLQEGAVYDRIRVREALWLYASFYPHPIDAGELLRTLGLEDREEALYADLSGGQKRRVQLALALIGDPEVVILDEPTTGLDPQARAGVWDVLRALRDRGRTVLVTTHYLEEAEEHADLAAIMDRGRLVALDAPARLLAGSGLESRLSMPVRDSASASAIAANPLIRHAETIGDRLVVYGASAALLDIAQRNGVAAHDLEIRRVRLEDLFLLMTGREYRDT